MLDDESRLDALLRDFAAVAGKKMLVHGGGRQATTMAQAMGMESRMIDGRRVTDAEMLRVVTMVYGGLVNKTMVARLQALGVNALGLTGADVDLLRSHRRPVVEGVDYGFVGDIDQVNHRTLRRLLDADIVPVVAPITHDGQGQLLNTNADTIATELAIALSEHYAVHLLFAFEKSGVLANPADEESVITELRVADFPTLEASSAISGGMLPKLRNAVRAVRQGVREVSIGKSIFMTESEGTRILR